MDPGEIMIASTDGIHQVTVLLDETPIKITEGFGGWEVVTRPRKKGLTEWKGRNPFGATIAILFDGWATGQNDSPEDQEPKIRELVWMALPKDQIKAVQEEPPVVKITGQALPYPMSTTEWIINNIEFGDKTIWMMLGAEKQEGVTAARVRQDVVLTLIEYVNPDRAVVTGANKGLSPKPTAPYHVKKGDTLKKLAITWYGDANMAQTIADVNNIRDTKKLPKLIKHIP
jgi:hypothetical protein